MKKSVELISVFYQLHNKFPYLHSYHYSRNFNENGSIEQSFKIILCDYPYYEDDKKLAITFSNVIDLKIGNTGGIVGLFIDIADISNYQWEGMKYKVKEEEEETFTFYCKSFEFEVF
ncbi:hypothetical protein AB4Z45_16250 [Paenibacillus sp. MCAF9]|uniref:hypothetical protein n=1 Tax=Paenibacillus sp. MCAF9 TaxID=3233046 RepID=UPI003F98CCF6